VDWFRLQCCSGLMRRAGSFVSLVSTCKSARRHSPEQHRRHLHRRENCRSHMDSFSSGYEPVVGSCEHRNESSRSIKGEEFLE
jgi:hypothetical protein